MSVCKICLCSDPKNDVSELKSTENVDQSGEYILLFCLGIQVIQNARANTKFCERCFTKLAEFHQFKSLALKNEATLSSLGLQKYIENGIKSEVMSQAGDYNEYDEPLIDCIELQEGKPLEEISSQYLLGKNAKYGVINPTNTEHIVFEVPEKQGLKYELSDDEPLSNKKKSRKTSLVKKEKHRKIAECSEDTKDTSCHVCGKQLKTNYLLKMHLETHMPKEERKSFECAHCNNKFTKKKALEKHIIKAHSEEVSEGLQPKKRSKERIQCDLCPASYLDRKNLQQHLSSAHTGYKPQCPICNKRFSEIYLQSHIRTKHESETLPYKCETCDRRFVRNSLLQRHVSIHSGVKPFSCDICDAKFRLKYSVRLHKAQVHDKSRNHVCHICSKRYFTGSLLQRHIRKHSKPINLIPGYRPGTIKREVIKTVECPDCGKPMASEKSLKHHRLLHKGQQYHCHICGLTFATRSYVVNHLKTHTQVRKFSCQFCKATFVRSSARRRHELEIHINAGEKKPPRQYSRKNKCRKKKVKEVPNLPTVMVSVPGHSVQELGQDMPISGPFKTEDVLQHE